MSTLLTTPTAPAATRVGTHRAARRRALVLTLVKVALAVAVGLVAVAVLQHAAPALADHFGASTMPASYPAP